MDFLDVIRNRRSVRRYTSDIPTREQVDALIELAISAPSAANRQCWSFCVITKRTLLDRLSAEAKAYMTAKRPLDLPEQLYAKLADPAFHVFYNAPALILISAKTNAPWNAEDCALAAQNIMVGAPALGLGTCWIGLCQPFLDTPEGRALIDLAADETPFAPIIVGRPAAAAEPVPRGRPNVRWIV